LRENLGEKMGIKLDELDVGILKLFQRDGRMLYKDVASHLNVSLPTIRARVKRLRELGVIKKFMVVVDPDKIFGKIRAVFVIEGKTPELESIGAKLAEMEEVREVFLTTGAFGIIAMVEVDNIVELEELITRKIAEIPNILDAKTSVVVKTLKEEFGISVKPEAVVQLRCAFCGGIIVEEPYVEEINGVKYYFHGKACADGYKEKLRKMKTHEGKTTREAFS